MSKITSFIVSLLLGIGLLIWVIRIVGWQEIKSSFLIFTGWQGVIILFLSFLILFAGTWKWKVILKKLGYDISSKELLVPYLSCFSINYLFQMIVVGGEVFRISILKEKHGVPWKKAIVSVIVDKMLEITAFLIFLLIGLAFFLLKIGLPPQNLGIILGAFLSCIVGGVIFFYFKSFKRESIARPLAKFFNRKGLANEDVLEIEKEVFRYFKFKKMAFWQGLSLAFFMAAASWLRCWILILFLGKSITFFPSTTIFSSFYIARLIPIPADLGSAEAIQFFTFSSLGLGAGIAPAFAIIIRGAELILALIGIIFLFKLGIGLFQTFLFKKIDNLLNHRN